MRPATPIGGNCFLDKTERDLLLAQSQQGGSRPGRETAAKREWKDLPGSFHSPPGGGSSSKQPRRIRPQALWPSQPQKVTWVFRASGGAFLSPVSRGCQGPSLGPSACSLGWVGGLALCCSPVGGGSHFESLLRSCFNIPQCYEEIHISLEGLTFPSLKTLEPGDAH